jgi:hypothetical protein
MSDRDLNLWSSPWLPRRAEGDPRFLLNVLRPQQEGNALKLLLSARRTNQAVTPSAGSSRLAAHSAGTEFR